MRLRAPLLDGAACTVLELRSSAVSYGFYSDSFSSSSSASQQSRRLPIRSLSLVLADAPRPWQHAVASADAPFRQLDLVYLLAKASFFGRLAHVLPLGGDAQRRHRRAVRRLPPPAHGTIGRLTAVQRGASPRILVVTSLHVRAASSTAWHNCAALSQRLLDVAGRLI